MIDLLGGPCATISPRNVRFNYRSHRRVDRVRKANGASQFKVGDSARTRERRSERGTDCREGNRERRREAYLWQSTKRYTTEKVD